MEVVNVDQSSVVEEMKLVARNMSGWIKFLGIMNIIAGGLTALTIFGIIIAWLPIWLGVVLVQAANRGTSASLTNNPKELVHMLDRLRLYFVIEGVLVLICLAMAVLGLLLFGVSLPFLLDQVQSEISL